MKPASCRYLVGSCLLSQVMRRGSSGRLILMVEACRLVLTLPSIFLQTLHNNQAPALLAGIADRPIQHSMAQTSSGWTPTSTSKTRQNATYQQLCPPTARKHIPLANHLRPLPHRLSNDTRSPPCPPPWRHQMKTCRWIYMLPSPMHPGNRGRR